MLMKNLKTLKNKWKYFKNYDFSKRIEILKILKLIYWKSFLKAKNVK